MTADLLSRIGGVEHPVNATDIASTGTLASLDRGRDLLLDYLATVLNSELSAAFDAVKSKVGPLASRSVVQTKCPFAPDPKRLKAQTLQYPALFLARSGTAQWNYHSLQERRLTQTWTLDYVLGPIDYGDERVMTDVLIAAARIVDLAIEQGAHADYQSGVAYLGSYRDSNGTLVGAGFSRIEPKTDGMGPASFAEDSEAVYWALSMTLETEELSEAVPGAAAELQGADMTFGTGDGSGIDADLIQVTTDLP